MNSSPLIIKNLYVLLMNLDDESGMGFSKLLNRRQCQLFLISFPHCLIRFRDKIVSCCVFLGSYLHILDMCTRGWYT